MSRFAVSTCHHLATSSAVRVLQEGGNAIDAAVTAAFVLQVVEPHLNGPAGEVVALIRLGGSDKTVCLSGVGPAPKAASISAFADRGFDLIPSTGVASAPVPGQFHALTTLLESYGTLPLERVMRPAASLAISGFPVTRSLHEALSASEIPFLRKHPQSAAHWIPRGVPAQGTQIRNVELGQLLEKIIEVSRVSPSTTEGIRVARDYWYHGPVAEAIHAHVVSNEGFLTYEDITSYSSSFEDPIEYQSGEHSIVKAGPWTQGAVLPLAWTTFQRAYEGIASDADKDYIHALVESIRLAMADRDAYLGDGATCVSDLLQESYLASRAQQITATAMDSATPGAIAGARPWLAPNLDVPTPISQSPWAPERLGRGDTCHVSIMTRDGTGLSLTASGGWLQSSPVIPSLGFALSTRLQQLWLDPASPSALTPGMRPRVTLTPTLVLENGQVRLSLGSPGGDGQDQWQLHALVRILLLGKSIHEAVSDFAFQSISFNNSFWPREQVRKGVLLEADAPTTVRNDLERRGHRIFQVPRQSLGRLSIVSRDIGTGEFTSAVSPRSGYAMAYVG